MNTLISSTAAATSDLTNRVREALNNANGLRSPEQVAHLAELKRLADDLGQKGLLRRREYAESSSADLRKRYLSRGG